MADVAISIVIKLLEDVVSIGLSDIARVLNLHQKISDPLCLLVIAMDLQGLLKTKLFVDEFRRRVGSDLCC